ncbi:TolC family protein [Desertivirga arenae]|uniref:TolC family protein n=1 Tax=Desertivirga arenae TaxID=2810309 RepID=UPI001F60D71E|nr:TolC family protein [Pedobacter sp. SYSU D00823]
MLSIKTRYVLLAALSLLPAFGSFAQKPLTLQEILREIELNNPSLKSYDNMIKSQEAKVEGAGAWMAPMIGAGTFMTPYPGQGMVGEGDKGAFMISAEQDIPNPAKLKARKEYQRSLSQTYFFEKNIRFNELRATARRAFFDLLIATKKYKFQKENQQIVQNMKKLAEIRYPFNQGSLTQIFKVEGRGFDVDNMLLMTEGEIRSKKITLNTLMNRLPNAHLTVDTNQAIAFNPVANLDTTYFSETRSDVLHMQHDIHSMLVNIKAMKQEAKPDFRLRFDHMDNYAAMMPTQFTAMGMISIPIAPWSSKMYKSEVKSMSYQKTAMEQQKQAMVIEMLGMARGMENELLTMQKQLNNYENKILPTLNKALKAAMITFQQNKGDANMMMESWDAQNMGQMNYLDQLQKFYQMIADYEKIIER